MASWHLLDATAAESALFAVPPAGGELAAPPNRWREVHRIDTPQGTYYLKRFRRTQWKNQVRNLLTAPRCRHDAARELAVARALQAAGVGIARPIGIGHDGPASYYLCAAVPGTSLRELLARGERPPGLAQRLGAILKGGIRLPDLSAEHVFVGAHGLALIDLHNGSLGRPRPRDLARLLRRFARSVQDLALPRLSALRFARRLIAAAGLSARARAILARVPPFDTHGRYDLAGKSRAYGRRSRSRHEQELALLRRVWPGSPGELWLDVPCGGGRVRTFLETALGVRTLGIDRSRAMLGEDPAARARVLAEAIALPIADRACAGTLVFRFLHHLRAVEARMVVHEACRVAKDHVVVSFFHPVSVHGVVRRIAAWVTGRAPTRFALLPHRLQSWMWEEGFVLADWAAQRPYCRDLWLGVFRRACVR